MPYFRLAPALALMLVLAAAYPAVASHPDCPYCVKPASTSSEELLNVSVKWCGLSESLTVADPSLFCQTSFKVALWRRHERASECVWIPQAKITLRSGGAIQKEDYVRFADPIISTGSNPGDVRTDDTYSGSERQDIYEQCDLEWAAQPKGLIAINASRLVDGGGNVDARGKAFQGSITMPFLTIADQENLGQLNERSLAHEAGHILNLGHVSPAGRLMQTGGTGSTLIASEIDTARQYLSDNTILDPPAEIVAQPDLVDFFYDPAKDAEIPHLDIRKVVFFDNSASGRDFSVHLAFAGLFRHLEADTFYAIALDTDGEESTGMDTSGVFQQMGMRGADLLGVARFGEGTSRPDDPDRRPRGQFVLFASIEGRPVQVYVDPELRMREVLEVTCDPPRPVLRDAVPVFSELSIAIPSKVLFAFGLPASGRLFPAGLRAQAVAFSPAAGSPDVGPDEAATLDFPAVVFPTAEAPAEAVAGETVSVTVRDMPADSPLSTFFGEFRIPLETETDADGDATFDLAIPAASPLGETLLTVGIPDPENAITADTTIKVVPPDDLEPPGKCRLSIEFLDLALLQLDDHSALGALPPLQEAIRIEAKLAHHHPWSKRQRKKLDRALLEEVAAAVKLEVAAVTDPESAKKLIEAARYEIEAARKVKHSVCGSYYPRDRPHH